MHYYDAFVYYEIAENAVQAVKSKPWTHVGVLKVALLVEVSYGSF